MLASEVTYLSYQVMLNSDWLRETILTFDWSRETILTSDWFQTLTMDLYAPLLTLILLFSLLCTLLR